MTRAKPIGSEPCAGWKCMVKFMDCTNNSQSDLYFFLEKAGITMQKEVPLLGFNSCF